MKKLSRKGKGWLKSIHILFISAWVGSGISMLVINQFDDTSNGVSPGINLLDNYVIIPSAIGTLISGVLLCWLTNWGFLKYRWIIVKWISTVSQMLFGAFILGPAINSGIEIALYFPILQQLLLIALVFVSVFKPWGVKTFSKPSDTNVTN